jgi:hypothetical protein
MNSDEREPWSSWLAWCFATLGFGLAIGLAWDMYIGDTEPNLRRVWAVIGFLTAGVMLVLVAQLVTRIGACLYELRAIRDSIQKIDDRISS